MFSEDVANFLIQHLGTIPYLVPAFGLFLVVPILILLALTYFLVKSRREGFDGVLFGFAIGAWASICWLVVPYCGAYPCLPGLLATMVVFQAPPVDTLPEELLVHAVNFVLWPAAGWLLFWGKARFLKMWLRE